MGDVISLDGKGRMKVPSNMRGAVEKLTDKERNMLLIFQLVRIAVEHTLHMYAPVIQKLSKEEKKSIGF